MTKQALTLALLLVTAGSVQAGQIYKWTDEDGNVHFSDTPVGKDSERVPIQSRPTDSARVDARVRSRAEAASRKAEEEAGAQAAAEAAGPTEEEMQARADERAQKCQTYRDRLQQFVQSRRIYREDENGERVYLSEEEMREAREQVEKQVQEYCST